MSFIKDCADICSLFDHQPFVSKEIDSFAKEFEDKRCDNQVESLLETLNVTCELRDVQCDKFQTAAKSQFSPILENLDKCLKAAHSVLKNSHSEDLKLKLEAKRKFRSVEFESFKEDLREKYAEVDSQFQQDAKVVEKYYLEKQKREPSSSSPSPDF